MPYDKNSFLAGLAAGRNAESWPANGYNLGTDVFMFTVSVTGGVQFDSPYYVLKGEILWGDGSAIIVDNDPGDVSPGDLYNYRRKSSHTYADSGKYQIIMLGILKDFSVERVPSYYDETPYESLISIDTPFPEGMSNVQYLKRNFRYTPNLKSVPPNLLVNVRDNLVSAEATFFHSGITSIPGELFYGCNAQLYRTFEGSELLSLPANLFADSPELTSLTRTFFGFKGTSIPEGLFDPLFNLGSVAEIFSQAKLTSIPYEVFNPVNNPNMYDFRSAFYGLTDCYNAAPPLWERYPDFGIYTDECFAYGNFSNKAEIPREWKGSFE